MTDMAAAGRVNGNDPFETGLAGKLNKQQHNDCRTEKKQESRMTIGTPKRGAPRLKSKREKLEYYMIFAASFMFFLVAAALSSLMRLSGMAAEQAGERSQSILKQAWSAADTTTSYAFMG